MQHTVVATQLNVKRKYTTYWYTRGTQQLQRYTTITAVHNIYSGVQHIHEKEIFRLSEGQVASTTH